MPLIQEPSETTENSPETLQSLSFEIINRLITIWRNFEDKSSRGKGRVFRFGLGLHSTIIDALRYNKDLQDLKQLHAIIEELEHERELARKSGLTARISPATEQAPST